jgi:hypothetical protein
MGCRLKDFTLVPRSRLYWLRKQGDDDEIILNNLLCELQVHYSFDESFTSGGSELRLDFSSEPNSQYLALL